MTVILPTINFVTIIINLVILILLDFELSTDINPQYQIEKNKFHDYFTSRFLLGEVICICSRLIKCHGMVCTINSWCILFCHNMTSCLNKKLFSQSIIRFLFFFHSLPITNKKLKSIFSTNSERYTFKRSVRRVVFPLTSLLF